ncbi:hypothetical protein Tco_1347136 [Tanacetum coccineum]
MIDKITLARLFEQWLEQSSDDDRSKEEAIEYLWAYGKRKPQELDDYDMEPPDKPFEPTPFINFTWYQSRGVANAVAETCWLRNLLRELHTPLSTATLVYCDNFTVFKESLQQRDICEVLDLDEDDLEIMEDFVKLKPNDGFVNKEEDEF